MASRSASSSARFSAAIAASRSSSAFLAASCSATIFFVSSCILPYPPFPIISHWTAHRRVMTFAILLFFMFSLSLESFVRRSFSLNICSRTGIFFSLRIRANFFMCFRKASTKRLSTAR